MSIPEIKMDERGIVTLYVKGEPFFALGGEVHNSAAESLENMEQNVWPYLEQLHLNTVIVPIYWDRIEETEGKYDFTLLDGLLGQAKARGVHLILLWFGLWKNAESAYVPGWMKRDTKTYFRAEKVNGERINTISPFCQAAVEKDAAAFAQMMKRIREIDEAESTVIMVQVENEAGLLGTPCDYCPAAGEAFEKPVPQRLLDKMDKAVGSNWKDTFGEEAEETFMAWQIASDIEKIASSGQKEYPLPMYVNAWLRQHPWYAGAYPSGGPVIEKKEVWKTAAPSIFAMAPDIYVPYVADVMESYSREDNPLVIPEVRKDAITASYALYAFGHLHALCYSPFGIEELGMPPEKVTKIPPEMIAALKMDPLAFDLTGSKDALNAVYDLITQMKPLYLKHRGTRGLQCYLKKNDQDQGTYLRFSKYDIEVAYLPKMAGCPAAAGMIVEWKENQFLIAGMMSHFTFHQKPGQHAKIDFLKLESGSVVQGEWVPLMEMNGDEKGALICAGIPACFMVELFEY